MNASSLTPAPAAAEAKTTQDEQLKTYKEQNSMRTGSDQKA
jgi:hypothetical protein